MDSIASDSSEAKPAIAAADRRTLSVAALVVFIVSFFLPFLVQSDAGVVGAIAGYILAGFFAVLSRARLLGRVVLGCLAAVIVLGTVNYVLFRHAGIRQEREVARQVQEAARHEREMRARSQRQP